MEAMHIEGPGSLFQTGTTNSPPGPFVANVLAPITQVGSIE